MGFLRKAVERATPKAKTLYFPGCLAQAKLPGVVEATRAALHDMGEEFVTLPLECCGYAAWYAGHEEEFAEILARNRRRLAEARIERVITNCPHCALTFKERYGVETLHTLEVFDSHLEKIRHKEGVSVTYHHPCFLDKLGVDERVGVRVLRRSGAHAHEGATKACCGSVGGDYERNNPEEAKLIAAKLAASAAGPIITACPHCHLMLKRQHKDVKDVAEAIGDQ